MRDHQLSGSVSELEARITRARRWIWILVVLGVIVAAPIVLEFRANPEATWAHLGDALAGTTGVLWALAGLVMIYAAFLVQQQQVLQQQEELQHAKEELRLTRQEIVAQTATLEAHSGSFAAQARTAEAQRFDSAFFQMLAAHETFVRDLRTNALQNPVEGRTLFVQLYGEMIGQSRHAGVYPGSFQLPESVTLYNEFYGRLESTLGPYFRSLYQVMRFVDGPFANHLAATEKKRYGNIVRARLSAEELLVMFYNVASSQGYRFRSLVMKYDLLKHLPKKRLLNPNHWDEFLELPESA